MGYFDALFNNGVCWTKAHSTQLLTFGMGIGVVVTGVCAFRAGMKAATILEEKRKDLEDTAPDDKETKREITKETVKELIPVVLPAVAAGIFTIFCGVKAESINSTKLLNYASIAGIATKQAKDINDEIKETFGDKKAKQIRSKAMQRRFTAEHPNDDKEYKYLLDCGGDVLCCDIYGDVYFLSTHEKVNHAIEALGYQCAEMGKVDLNDLYSKLGIPEKDWATGVFWNYKDIIYEPNNFGVPIPKLPIETTTVMGFNDRPCLGIRYDFDGDNSCSRGILR